jgi:hypothetical protein
MAIGSIPVFSTFGSLSTGFGINIDLKGLAGLIPLLNDFGDRVVAEMMFEATKLFDEAYDMSQALVHVITGQLKGSGVVATQSGTEIVFGYRQPYADVEEQRKGGKYQTHEYVKPAYDYIVANLETRMVQALDRHISAAATA